jgi:heme/copper-type cytochrome/quinol oxidase subunit 2
MNKVNSKSRILLVGIVFLFFEISSYAQCAMCRAALTSEGNKQKAEAVNDGIVYLMVIPYILVAAIGYFVYRMKKAPHQTSPKGKE